MIQVNDRSIPESALAAEVQHHPAPTLETARSEAARALVVRELLLQEAWRLKVEPSDSIPGEAKEEALIRALLEQEIALPELSEENCRRYYVANKRRFRSPDLFEAAHILFAAAPEDEENRHEARTRAAAALELLKGHPERFSGLAKELSDCSSRDQGGSLGQVARGQTCSELETFFYALEPGQIAPEPVPSRYGYHLLRLDQRALGETLPYESVRERIADYLRQQSWQRAVRQYIQILAGQARIEGFALEAADSPLVQ
ncbi:peptidylprolyl isomerase [Aquibaculum sediminis]|uniref:peptidylprolyl isomerase n=1 Tax=Aquibaculum sediminis TaxID=3231907 RepID=UPI003451C892